MAEIKGKGIRQYIRTSFRLFHRVIPAHGSGPDFWKFDLPNPLLGSRLFQVQNGYPKEISLWNLPPPFSTEGIDAAFWFEFRQFSYRLTN